MEAVGRDHEIRMMHQLLDSSKSEFLAIYGRRRIGKTFLIQQVFAKYMTFSMTGLHYASVDEQLQNFSISLSEFSHRVHLTPKNWLEAFQLLKIYIESSRRQSKKVIFIDELPWLSTPKSGFLSALEHFWNAWAAKRQDIILVVCGSAASWMIHNLLRNKGGLHNRITSTIRLEPFTLYETEQLLIRNGIKLSLYQIAQIYMVTGGVPYYLMAIQKGMSVPQIINDLCYRKDALLRHEFEYLFESLFGVADHHHNIIQALLTRQSGMMRSDILQKTKLPNAGSTTRLLEELEESGFITRQMAIDKKSKDALYRITDFYTIFYHKFIKATKIKTNTYLTISQMPEWVLWQGFAFENICMYHIVQIKAALGIAGVNTLHGAWSTKGTQVSDGAQIDLIIDRDDAIISICEAKFSQEEYTISKTYRQQLAKKIEIFRSKSKTKKTIFLAMITTNGTTKNEHYYDIVQNEVTLVDLFRR
jgi:uncharacterized protein